MRAPPIDSAPQTSRRVPWNKGKLIGAKPPLRPKHVWSIRTKLQIAGRIRDLAMFNLAIDSKLRGCDVVIGTSCLSSTGPLQAVGGASQPLRPETHVFPFGQE